MVYFPVKHSCLYNKIGRLSETAKKKFCHLKCTDSSSFNHKSFSFQKCSKENRQSNLFGPICFLMNSLSLDISHVFAWNVCGLRASSYEPGNRAGSVTGTNRPFATVGHVTDNF